MTDGFVTTPLVQNLIVFTDLDGTLLDHATYSHAEATPALERLRERAIPLVLASSKTGGTYQRLRQTLDAIPAPLREQYQGFADWSAEDVSRRTGLPLEDAANAKIRNFSEPGLWLGSEQGRDEFVSAARAAGLTVQQGGRFLTLSFGGNKAERMMEIAGRYANAGKDPFVVALGDAQNDVAMIEQADLGVIIPNPAHKGHHKGRFRRPCGME